MMKPKGEDKSETGLLEYLEDIIGTDQYKQPIDEAASKLEELNDQRQTAVHRVKRAGAQSSRLPELDIESVHTWPKLNTCICVNS
jgi:structural maintenance of chromosome 4